MKRMIAAGIAAAAMLASFPATASAMETYDQPTWPSPYPVVDLASPLTISPYGNTARCAEYRGSVGDCFQQRPDGQWVKLTKVAQVIDVYPVWEDPGSLMNLVPAQLRDQAVRLSS